MTLILKDKITEELNREEFFVVELSQGDKLFRVGVMRVRQRYQISAYHVWVIRNKKLSKPGHT